jgi:hypothetical protein
MQVRKVSGNRQPKPLRGFTVEIAPDGTLTITGEGLEGEECVESAFNRMIKASAEIEEQQDLEARSKERPNVDVNHVRS